MKTHLLTALSLLLALTTYAQVGIGTSTPDPSPQLDVVSTDKGVLVSRLISTTAVTAPVEGLLVYQTGSPAGFYLYTQGSWQRLITEQQQSEAIAAATAPLSAALLEATTPSFVVAKAFVNVVPPGNSVRFTSVAIASPDITFNLFRDTYTVTKPGWYIVAYSLVVQGSQDRVTLYRDGSFLPISSSISAIGPQTTLLTNNVSIFLDTGSQLQLRNSTSSTITVTDGTINITRM